MGGSTLARTGMIKNCEQTDRSLNIYQSRPIRMINRQAAVSASVY